MTTPAADPPPPAHLTPNPPVPPLPPYVDIPQQRAEPPAGPVPARSPERGYAVLGLIGGALIIVGSFLPWLTYSIATPYGLQQIHGGGITGGDSWYTIPPGIIALVIGLAGLVGAVPRWLRLALLLCAGMAALVIAVDLPYMLSEIQRVEYNRQYYQHEGQWASIASGMYALVFGAVFTALGGLLAAGQLLLRSAARTLHG